MSEIKWSIDSICRREGTIYGYGWILHPYLDIERLSVRAHSVHNEARELFAEYGKSRPDVAEAFPGIPNARNSGFILLGPCPSGGDELVLHCRFSNGTSADLPIPVLDLSRHGSSFRGRNWRSGARLLASLLSRAWVLLLRGKWRSLASKATRYFRGRPARLNDPICAVMQRVGDAQTAIIIDHDLGGGANKYRERYVENRRVRGAASVVYSFHVPTLSLQVLIVSATGVERVAFNDASDLLALAAQLKVDEIVYNTGVSFPRPEHIPGLLVALKQVTHARLMLTVHDFFMLCPSHFLLNSHGHYCGVPEVSVCNKCLPQNTQGFASMFRSLDIEAWRKAWWETILIADEVRCFSTDSANHFFMAYPRLERQKVTVVPHVHYSEALRPVVLSRRKELVIGVIGQIGYHKGGEVIAALAEEIVRHNLAVKIVVIGEIESRCNPQVVKQTGGYRSSELPDLIERHGVCVVLFSSIWPETFSYVVQEVMQMQLPIACFDWGAPAERIKSYRNGLILQSSVPSRILSDLLVFVEQQCD